MLETCRAANLRSQPSCRGGELVAAPARAAIRIDRDRAQHQRRPGGRRRPESYDLRRHRSTGRTGASATLKARIHWSARKSSENRQDRGPHGPRRKIRRPTPAPKLAVRAELLDRLDHRLAAAAGDITVRSDRAAQTLSGWGRAIYRRTAIRAAAPRPTPRRSGCARRLQRRRHHPEPATEHGIDLRRPFLAFGRIEGISARMRAGSWSRRGRSFRGDRRQPPVSSSLQSTRKAFALHRQLAPVLFQVKLRWGCLYLTERCMAAFCRPDADEPSLRGPSACLDRLRPSCRFRRQLQNASSFRMIVLICPADHFCCVRSRRARGHGLDHL